MKVFDFIFIGRLVLGGSGGEVLFSYEVLVNLIEEFLGLEMY